MVVAAVPLPSGFSAYLQLFLTDGGVDAGPWFRAVLPLYLDWVEKALVLTRPLAHPACCRARSDCHCRCRCCRCLSHVP